MVELYSKGSPLLFNINQSLRSNFDFRFSQTEISRYFTTVTFKLKVIITPYSKEWNPFLQLIYR